MLERYERALRLTAPKLASEVAEAAVEGYWLDASLFFFLAQRREPSLGRVLAVPLLFHAETDSVEEVIALDILASLLSVNLEALAHAEFDMPNRNTLAVKVQGHEYLVDRVHK